MIKYRGHKMSDFENEVVRPGTHMITDSAFEQTGFPGTFQKLWSCHVTLSILNTTYPINDPHRLFLLFGFSKFILPGVFFFFRASLQRQKLCLLPEKQQNKFTAINNQVIRWNRSIWRFTSKVAWELFSPSPAAASCSDQALPAAQFVSALPCSASTAAGHTQKRKRQKNIC